MSENIRFGIIGTGSIATACHGPALQDVEGVRLWSVLSRDHDRAAGFAHKFGAEAPHAAHDSLEEFLSDSQLQAVIITSPDNLHAEHIKACARTGKHILVEKPMVTSVEDGLEVLKLCAEAGVTLGVGFHLRWHAGHRELHRLVTEENVLGDVQDIKIRWMTKAPNNANWRAGEELGRWWSLAANGSHCIDLMHWFADNGQRQPASCKASFGKEKWGGPHEETVDARFTYSDGLSVSIATSVIDEPSSLIEITGSKGRAVCENTLSRFSKGIIAVNGQSLSFAATQPFYAQLADFAAAIREGRAAEVDGLQGLLGVEDMVIIDNSAHSGVEVSLQNIKKPVLPVKPNSSGHKVKFRA